MEIKQSPLPYSLYSSVTLDLSLSFFIYIPASFVKDKVSLGKKPIPKCENNVTTDAKRTNKEGIFSLWKGEGEARTKT